MAKIMRTKNLKIQMLAGNRLKICVDASFEIISTLVFLVQTKNTMLWESSSYSRTLLCSNFFQIICTLSFPSKNWTCSIFFHSSQNSYDRCYGSFRLQPSLIGFLLRGIRMHTQNRVQNKRMLKCFHLKIMKW